MTKRLSQMTPEEAERTRAKSRAYKLSPAGKAAENRSAKKRYAKWKALPEDERPKEDRGTYFVDRRARLIAEDEEAFREREREQGRSKYQANADRRRLQSRAKYLRDKLRGKDKKPAQNVFVQISKLCVRDFNKDDIIAEAFIMVMQGKPVDEAVKLARRKANKFGNEMRFNTTDIDDAFWLGEPADFGDSKDDI